MSFKMDAFAFSASLSLSSLRYAPRTGCSSARQQSVWSLPVHRQIRARTAPNTVRCVATGEPDTFTAVTSREDVVTVAFVAHINHGKRSMCDALLRGSTCFKENEVISEHALERIELEKKRGIMINASSASLLYKDVKVKILDTPGNADFGGEVERVLNMTDGVLLLVDGVEGPNPQTRFVLKKAIELGKPISLIINKMDRENARPQFVVDATFDLMAELGASDEQMDFKIAYASAIKKQSGTDPETIVDNMDAIFDLILDFPRPKVNVSSPLQMPTNNVTYDDFKGRLASGMISAGSREMATPFGILEIEGTLAYEGFKVTYTYGVAESDEPPLLLLGGAFQGGSSWTPLKKNLTKSWLTVDLPGVPGNGVLPRSYDCRWLASSLLSVLDELSIETVDIVSFSYATPVAYCLASMFPERVNRMVMAGCGKDFGKTGNITETWIRQLLASIKPGSPRFYFQAALDGVIFNPDPTAKIYGRDKIRRIIWRQVGRLQQPEIDAFVENSHRLLLMNSYAHELSPPQCLTLGVTGEYDRFTTPEGCRALLSELPRSVVTTVLNADHMFALENRQALADLLKCFFSGNWNPPESCTPFEIVNNADGVLTTQ